MTRGHDLFQVIKKFQLLRDIQRRGYLISVFPMEKQKAVPRPGHSCGKK